MDSWGLPKVSSMSPSLQPLMVMIENSGFGECEVLFLCLSLSDNLGVQKLALWCLLDSSCIPTALPILLFLGLNQHITLSAQDGANLGGMHIGKFLARILEQPG